MLAYLTRSWRLPVPASIAAAVCTLALAACSDDAGTPPAAGSSTGVAPPQGEDASTHNGPQTGADTTSAMAGSSEGGGSTDDGSSTGDGGPTAVDYADVYALDATFPEGGAFDPVDALFFVGTLEAGAVHQVDPRNGDNTVLFDEAVPGEWITLGMAVDAPGRTLWVCAADRTTDPFTGQLWVFDLTTGARQAVVPLSANGGPAWCEDVAVGPDGTAYATDRENPNIYRVSGVGATAELFASDDALGSGAAIGQNGIIVLPDGAGLIATVHLPSALNHISLEGTVTPVEIDGDFADAGIGSGADGMVYVDGSLYVVFDGELARVTPTLADWSAANSVAVKLPRGLTDVVQTPGGLYLLNGQAIRFAFGQDPNGPFELVRFTGAL